MVHHEASYRLSQPLPLGTALMLLAKCPVVAETFTSKQAITTASNDGIGFLFFVCVFSELRPSFTGRAMSNRIALLEVKFLEQHKMVAKANVFAKNIFIHLW